MEGSKMTNSEQTIADKALAATETKAKAVEKKAEVKSVSKHKAGVYRSDKYMRIIKALTVQHHKDSSGQICYKRVGTAEAGTPWNNREIRFDQYFDNGAKGTIFYCKKKKASVDLHMPGLQLREL